MSKEIAVNFGMTVTNGNYSSAWPQSFSQYDQVAQGAVAGTVATSTSLADLNYGGVTAVGFLVLKNLDSTNAIDWGIDSTGFVGVGTLKAGELAVLRVKTGVTFAVKAQAGTPLLQYWLLQN